MVRDGESPGDAKQENERQAEKQRRWACGGEAEARRGHGSARAGERLVQRLLTSISPGAGWTLNRKAHWMPGTLPALPRPDSAASPLPSSEVLIWEMDADLGPATR
jgi:hypothetical protein